MNITASHNPPSDNGFKVRNETGGAIDPEGLKQIEAGIPDDVSGVKRKDYKEATAAGEIVKFDAATPYIEHFFQALILLFHQMRWLFLLFRFGNHLHRVCRW